MRARRVTGRAVAAALIAALATLGLPTADGASPARPLLGDGVLVRFGEGVPDAARAQALATVGGRVARTIPRIGYQLLSVPGSAAQAVAALRALPAVEVAEPNVLGRAMLAPDDRCVAGCSGARQWAIDAVNARLGWDVLPGRFYTAAEKKLTDPVRIAVLDAKIVEHPDWANASGHLIANASDLRNGGQLDLENALDVLPPEAWPGSISWHGTFIGGIAAAAANNSVDIAGLAYGAAIIPVTVMDGNGLTDAATLAEGITHAAGVGARVINLSLGIADNSSAVQAAIDAATAEGALVVAAAGNQNNGMPVWPAWMNNVVAVASSDAADRPGSCSNHSARVAVAAPGVDVVSLDPTSATGVSVRCGTSAATPHVAALAAMLFAQNPDRTPADVRTIIEETADDDRVRAGRDDYMGYGRINVERALRSGDYPMTTGAAATIPQNVGGTSTLTARADAGPGGVVRAAQYRLGATGAWASLAAADGAFDERVEDLVAQIPVTVNAPVTGVHRLLVRASDGPEWGPAAGGVLIVDRTPPRLIDLFADAVTPGTAGVPATISFRTDDDFSARLTYTVTVTSRLTSVPVYRSDPKTINAGPESTYWIPQVTDAGPHDITVLVRDEAGNPVAGRTSTLVV